MVARTSGRRWITAVVVLAGASAWLGEPAGGTGTTTPDTVDTAPPTTVDTTPASGPDSTDVATTDVSTSDAVTTDDTAAPIGSVPVGDGILRIGTLLPVSGPGNEFGIAAINAVNVGLTGINDSGGVWSRPVEWVQADEGETPDDARSGITSLLAAEVDAIIGPASSLTTLDTLDDLLAAGVLVCSPTATALALNDFPERGLFFRTVPSDSLTAQAIGVHAGNTGVDTFAVVYLDDMFGRPFAQQVLSRLDGPEITSVDAEPFSSDATAEELADLATQIAERGARTVIVVADAERGWPMLEALAAVFGDNPPFIIVNDALRSPPDREMVADLPDEFREAIQGLSPVVPPEGDEPNGVYATNALDCLNLIALSAVEAGVDDPAAIATEMLDVSVVGSLCNSFAECLEIVEENRNFNYQGANSIDFSTRGDPARGRLGTFGFDSAGLDVATGTLAITEVLE